MAMTVCPECSHAVSSKAYNCTACGYPLNKPKKSGFWWGMGCLMAIPALFIVISIIGLLAAIGIPAFQKARNISLEKTHEVSSVQTEWMEANDFHALLKKLEKKSAGKNYWDQGHWVNAVDGRTEAGAVQYKISYSTVPGHKGYTWYWWYDQNQESFNKHLKTLTDDGFILAHYQSFEDPDGIRKFQGVWHKRVD
jgi:hypothetical protein